MGVRQDHFKLLALEEQVRIMNARLSALEAANAPEVKKGPGGRFFVYVNDQIASEGFNTSQEALNALQA